MRRIIDTIGGWSMLRRTHRRLHLGPHMASKEPIRIMYQQHLRCRAGTADRRRSMSRYMLHMSSRYKAHLSMKTMPRCMVITMTMIPIETLNTSSMLTSMPPPCKWWMMQSTVRTIVSTARSLDTCGAIAQNPSRRNSNAARRELNSDRSS